MLQKSLERTIHNSTISLNLKLYETLSSNGAKISNKKLAMWMRWTKFSTVICSRPMRTSPALRLALDEIEGKDHSKFGDARYAISPEYAEFWRNLPAACSGRRIRTCRQERQRCVLSGIIIVRRQTEAANCPRSSSSSLRALMLFAVGLQCRSVPLLHRP
jgi:hypothetical protein